MLVVLVIEEWFTRTIIDNNFGLEKKSFEKSNRCDVQAPCMSSVKTFAASWLFPNQHAKGPLRVQALPKLQDSVCAQFEALKSILDDSAKAKLREGAPPTPVGLNVLSADDF